MDTLVVIEHGNYSYQKKYDGDTAYYVETFLAVYTVCSVGDVRVIENGLYHLKNQHIEEIEFGKISVENHWYAFNVI